MKKFLLLFTFFTLLPFSAVNGEVLTIDRELPEFIKLKQKYNQQQKNTVTPAQYRQLKQQYERDKTKALASPTYIRQKNVHEAAQAREIHKIERKYQEKLSQLKKNAVKMVEHKYKTLLLKEKKSSQQALLTQYISNLQQLEDKLLRLDDLEGAIVVRSERKKAMQRSKPVKSRTPEKKTKFKQKKEVKPVTPVKKKIKPATPVQKKAKPVTPVKKIAAPAPAPKKNIPSASHLYSSNQRGFAGANKSSKGNVYTFTITPTPRGAELIFHAYGRKSNDSYGEVFLIAPGGDKHQVAHWSPKQLKKSSYLDVSEAKHVIPITANISKYVKKAGAYTIEFLYRDGNDALIIYKAGIKTK